MNDEHQRGTHISDLPRPIALVMSGGASLGAVQVGQLRALGEAGLMPDFLVGTSVGAINALFIGLAGLTPARVDALEDVWSTLRREDVFGGLGLMSFLRAMHGSGTLATATGLQSLIARELPRRSAELALPVHVVAVEYLSGRQVVLSDGDPRVNALASAAIPNVFPPVELDGRLLVDGGLSANVPVAPAAKLGARTLVVLDAGFPCALSGPPRGLVPGILHAMTLALRNQIHLTLPGIAGNRVVIYLPAPCPLSVAPHDFSKTMELITVGHQVSRTFLSQLVLAGPGVYGHPHFHGVDASE